MLEVTKMKRLAKYKFFLPLLAAVFLGLALVAPVKAAIDVGSELDPPCQTNLDCPAGTRCVSRGGQKRCLQTVVPKNSLEDFQKKVVEAEEQGIQIRENWLFGSLVNVMDSSSTIVVGELDWEAINRMAVTGKRENIQIGGALGLGSRLVATVLSTPPASGVEYLADMGRNIGVVKSAYAQNQGIGFDKMTNLLPLWKATRNLAYILFVVIFIALGLMIMFRVKLDPKTVITIQNAIPRLVIALILVTFSYAIAGLLIDLTYLIIYLAILALEGPLKLAGTTVAAEQAKFVGLGFGEAVGLVFGGLTRAGAAFVGWLGVVVVGLIAAIVILFPPATLLGVAAVSLPFLIFLIIALFLIFKLFFSLISVYIQIILAIIFAPLQIMLGVLPGNEKNGFGTWFNNLLANIVIFPAVALFLLIGWILTSIPGPEWTPPVLGVGGGALTAFISFGVLLTVNRVPDIVKSFFAGKPFDFGKATEETLHTKQISGTAKGYGGTTFIEKPAQIPLVGTWIDHHITKEQRTGIVSGLFGGKKP